MTTEAEQVSAEIASALSLSAPDDLVRAVKHVVRRELEELTPDASVTLTEYYNHSYIPDMVVEWGQGTAKRTREVFIRQSLRSYSIQRDLETLSDRAPVVLGLAQARDLDQRVDAAIVREAMPDHARTLVTEVNTVAAIGSDPPPSDGDPRDIAAPLMRLIRTNVIEGGRGFLGEDQAQILNNEFRARPVAEEGSIDEHLTFEETVSELFAEDSAARIYRTAELLRRGLLASGEFGGMSGRLSPTELQIIIPFLLKHPYVTYDTEFWRRIGAMMTFEDLLTLGDELVDVDLTRLIKPNAEFWEARRMQLGLNAEFEEEQLGGWWISDQLLIGLTGGYRVSLAMDQRKLRGRHGGSAARWSEISELVDGYILESIKLRGLSRTISVSAENSINVKRDIDQIQQTIDDQFHVTELTLKPYESPTKASTFVNFLSWTATAEGGESLHNLTDIGLSLLGHRRRVDPDELLTPIASEPDRGGGYFAN